MKRNVPFLLLATLLAVLFLTAVARAELVASIDRQRLALDETLTLTISKDSSSFFSEPDLASLEPDFTVVSRNQSSSTQIINGQMSSSVQWLFVLAPKRTGSLQIPSFSMGKESTAPLSVEVTQEAPPKTQASGLPLFLETAVDQHEVWLQSQVVFTLRILWAVQAQIQEPDEPKLENAILEKLGDATFDKVINGQPYKVFERRYAIFPQSSGTLTIPQMTVLAEVAGQRRPGGFLDPFGGRGKPITLRSESETITVKEKPTSYPAAAAWLPADAFTLEANWSKQPETLEVGDSATLTITMVADGLPGAHLPPIELPAIAGVKLYQNKGEVANHATTNGITGSRQESIALVPTKPGTVELPEIRIPWWDKGRQQVQYAVLPATRLVIHGIPGEPTTSRPIAQAPTLEASKNEPAAIPTAVAPARPTLWIILTMLLALAWLATIYLWWRTRRPVAIIDQEPHAAKPTIARKEEEAFQKLLRACQANDPLQARTAILAWAASRWPQTRLHTLTDIAILHPDPRLAALFQELDHSLYGQGEQTVAWQGEGLLALIKDIRNNSKQSRQQKDELPPLYR